MTTYANLHIAFEQMRVRALRDLRGSPVPDYERDKPTDPPRVLVLGPENSGKTTICKLLINYAVRAGQGWSPLLINTDPAEVNGIFFVYCTTINACFRAAGQHQAPCLSRLYIAHFLRALRRVPSERPQPLPRPHYLRTPYYRSHTGTAMQKLNETHSWWNG